MDRMIIGVGLGLFPHDWYAQASEKERYAEIRRNLDCAQLLASLSHSHGLNSSVYEITKAKDGTPRIQCGSRGLSPSDFLTKEMGLAWGEAAQILRKVYENQIGKKIVQSNSPPHIGQLWNVFKRERLAGQPDSKFRLQEFDRETKSLRSSLVAQLKEDQASALAGLGAVERKIALSLEKLQAATAKVEFTEARRALRKALHPLPAQDWRNFLQAQAQEGNDEALEVLRKLDSTARAIPEQAISGTICLADATERARQFRGRASVVAALKALSHYVEINGDITYSSQGKAVLRDEGRYLAVLDPNSDQTIAAALLIAREKFGPALTITGTVEFQRRLVTVAVEQGISVKFIDPQIEALRIQLVESRKNHFQPVAVQRSEVSIPRVDAQPVVAMLPPAVEKTTDLPTALTADEWMASQTKPVVPAYALAPNVEFVVVHVGLDGVVLDHGRAVAKYEVSIGKDFNVGDRVQIGSDQKLGISAHAERDSGVQI